MLVQGLVAVGQQAVVARAHAALPVGQGGVVLLAGVRVEVHDLQGGAGGLAQRPRVVDEAAEHAGAALGALDEQRPAPAVLVGQALAGQLAVLELEGGLDAALQRDRGGDRGLQAHRPGQPGDQDVAAVLHVGDDPLLALDLVGVFQAVFLRGLVRSFSLSQRPVVTSIR